MSTDVMCVGSPDDPLPGPRMPRCESCLHWEQFEGMTGECQRILRRTWETMHPTLGQAQVWGNKGCTSLSLMTDAAFGCTLHEPKP